jgi:hypothetical protein
MRVHADQAPAHEQRLGVVLRAVAQRRPVAAGQAQ